MKTGWVKLYRSIQDWEWWTDLNTRVFFQYCLVKANHRPSQWRGRTIEVGQFVATIRSMATKEESGLTVSQLRTALKHLLSTHELTQETTHGYTILTISNFEKYQAVDTASYTQDDTPVDIPVTQDEENIPQTPYKELSRREEDNNIPPYNPPADEKPKRTSRQFVRPTLEEVAAYCQERGNNIEPQHFINYYDSCGWTVGKNKPMKDWKAAIRNWESMRKQSFPQPSSDNEQQNNNGFRIPSEMERAKSAFKF